MNEFKSDLIEISALWKRETDKAFCISADGETDVWVPKSQCQRDGVETFTMPEWLAKEKGFI